MGETIITDDVLQSWWRDWLAFCEKNDLEPGTYGEFADEAMSNSREVTHG